MSTEFDLKETELTGLIGREALERLSVLHEGEAWRAYRDTYDKASRLEVLTERPLQLDFELNATCNLKCPMCPISVESNKDKPRKDWFKFETFCALIDEGVANGLKAIKLNYINEPLMRKDLPDFISYAVKAGILDVYLSTNAILLTEKYCRELVASGLHRIQISIDAFTEDTYQQVRPGGDLQTVIDNVQLLKRVRDEMGSEFPLMRVNFVRTELNEHELDDFVAFWQGQIDMIGVQEMIKPPKSSREIKSATSRDKKKEGFRCSFPFKQLVVNNEGWILPCCTFYGEELKLGNIKDMTIEEAWNCDQINELRRIHSEGRYEENPACKACVEGAMIS